MKYNNINNIREVKMDITDYKTKFTKEELERIKIFGVHAWRNPEMELIFKIILNHGVKEIKE